MTNYWKLLLTCLTFVTSVGSAWAEEAPASSAEEAPAEEEPKTEVSLVAEAGLIWLAGNTQSITANGQVAFGIQRDGNRFSLNFGGAYGRSLVSTDVVDADGTVIRTDTEWVDTAKRVFGDARYDRFLVPDLNSIYVSGGAAHDPLAGLRFRAQGNAGYSHLLVNTDMHRFAAEAGGMIVYQAPVGIVRPVEHGGNHEIRFGPIGQTNAHQNNEWLTNRARLNANTPDPRRPVTGDHLNMKHDTGWKRDPETAIFRLYAPWFCRRWQAGFTDVSRPNQREFHMANLRR